MKRICLTPVKNESWILDRFLSAASIWADYIIISDQGSNDGSLEIAKKYEKVIIVDNSTIGDFNEYQIRKPLFDTARKIEGPKVFISLDADEFLTPNFDSPEWNTIELSAPGTIITIKGCNIYSDMRHYWDGLDIVCGYVDDGAPYEAKLVHTARSICPKGHPILMLHDIKMMHYQYTDWNRMMFKHRWYQCLELINKENNVVDIFRRYHHVSQIHNYPQKELPEWWMSKYAEHNIDMTSVLCPFDLEIKKRIICYFQEYGCTFFRHLDIWDVNWNEEAALLGLSSNDDYSDPRTIFEKAINKWLRFSQSKRNKIGVKIIDSILKYLYR